MAKVAITEGDKSRKFSGLKYLRTDLQGGGQCDWVSEELRELTTKTITKNGTYKISDEKGDYYGFSQVTVNVPNDKNKVIGTDPTSSGGDGNEYEVERDEDTGALKKTVLPSSIHVDGLPTKTTYNDGEAINKAGIVVKAYKKDGTLYDYSGYQQGAIPLSELTIEPTIADKSKASGSPSATSDLDLGDIKKPVPLFTSVHIYAKYQRNASTYYERSVDISIEGGVGAIKTLNNSSVLFFVATKSQAKVTTIQKTKWSYAEDWSSPTTSETYVNASQHGTYMYGISQIGFSLKGQASDSVMDFSCSVVEFSTYSGSVGNINEDNLAITMLYGDISYGTLNITVKWNRPEDEKLLTDTFDINIV